MKIFLSWSGDKSRQVAEALGAEQEDEREGRPRGEEHPGHHLRGKRGGGNRGGRCARVWAFGRCRPGEAAVFIGVRQAKNS